MLHRNSTDVERYHESYMMRHVAVLRNCGTACNAVRRIGGDVTLCDCRLDANDGSNTTKQPHSIMMEEANAELWWNSKNSLRLILLE
jgi:hypothetical protein